MNRNNDNVDDYWSNKNNDNADDNSVHQNDYSLNHNDMQKQWWWMCGEQQTAS